MAKRRETRSTDSPRPGGPSRVAGHRAKESGAPRPGIRRRGGDGHVHAARPGVPRARRAPRGRCPHPPTRSTSAASATRSNANDRRRAHEDTIVRTSLQRATTTTAQRNALLDPVRRTVARSGHTLASFAALGTPTALAAYGRDTEAAWNRNLARVRDYALRLDGAATRAQLVAAVDHLSSRCDRCSTSRRRHGRVGPRAPRGREVRPAAAEGHAHVHAASAARTEQAGDPRHRRAPSRDTPALGHRRGTAARADPAGAGAATVPAVDGTQPTGREHADAERASTDARPEQREHARSRRR